MQDLTRADAERWLARIVGLRCVQVWLGYGNALFLGLGDAILPPVDLDADPRRPHPHPPFEVQTNLAEWRVADPTGTVVTCEDAEIGAVASRLLLGRTLTCATLAGVGGGLDLEFDGVGRLSVLPYDAPEDSGEHAWYLTDPDGITLVVTIGGGYGDRLPHEPLYPRQPDPDAPGSPS